MIYTYLKNTLERCSKNYSTNHKKYLNFGGMINLLAGFSVLQDIHFF